MPLCCKLPHRSKLLQRLLPSLITMPSHHPPLARARIRFLLTCSAMLMATFAAAAPPAPIRDDIKDHFKDDVSQRVLACTGCHGPQGRAAPNGYYPRLAGKPAGYLYNQLINFRDGKRQYGLMTQLLAPLTDAYLMEIAQHFSSLQAPYPTPIAAQQSAEQLARGKQLVLVGEPAQGIPACVQCHGAAMTGVAPNVPGLLGLPRDYLNAQLGAWKTGQRRAQAPDCMHAVVRLLSSDDINAASSYLAALNLPLDTKPTNAAPPLAKDAVVMHCGSAPLNGNAVKAAP
jgi:cytochrome c553